MVQLSYSIKKKALNFLKSCKVDNANYRLCLNSEDSAYARCFAIFIKHLLKDESLYKHSNELQNAILISIKKAHKKLNIKSKEYRQLLAFSLSALSIINEKSPTLLNAYVLEQLQIYNKKTLMELGCLDGLPGSGNQAMFYGIFLIHAEKYLMIDTKIKQSLWAKSHLYSINKFGFWGNSLNLKHLHFQNGYHQYEIFEYIELEIKNISSKLKIIQNLKDNIGHFAPYPGGGGCYDYDAIFLLTSKYVDIDKKLQTFLSSIYHQLVSEQNKDGGFAENLLIDQKSFFFYKSTLIHLLKSISKPSLFKERLMLFISLHLKKNKRIKTHWTKYSRRWGESNLWDTWFRLLTIARIEISLENKNINNWGFIKYPGIGYHYLLKDK